MRRAFLAVLLLLGLTASPASARWDEAATVARGEEAIERTREDPSVIGPLEVRRTAGAGLRVRVPGVGYTAIPGSAGAGTVATARGRHGLLTVAWIRPGPRPGRR